MPLFRAVLLKDRSINRRINVARFPRRATLEEFDFSFQPGLNAKEIKELANLAQLPHPSPSFS